MYYIRKFDIIFLRMQYETSKWKSLVLSDTNFSLCRICSCL